MQRVKMADVARLAGVSAMTVSRALRADGTVAPGTRRAILKVVRDLGYLPDRQAQALSSQRSGFVAALVPSLNNPHFALSIGALTEVLEATGLQVLIGHTNYSAGREQRLVTELLRRRPEAIVVTVDGHLAATRKRLRQSGIPVIEIWDWPSRPIDHVVGFSNRDAACQMALHLHARGYRRIAYVGETDDAGTRGSRRRDGFLDAMRELALGEARVHNHSHPPINMMQGRQALAAVLARWPDTDAIMCVSDPCAYGAMVEAQARGLRVPEDIGIAGFGDFEISRCCSPALTTVEVNAGEIGRQAGELVLRLLGGEERNRGAPARIHVAARIGQRASTR